jgi:hypothetical protein
LRLGLYTVLARQSDVAGHVTTTPSARFIVVPNPPVIGTPTISQNGAASVPIYCSAKVNTLCVGSVTMVTTGKVSVGRHKRERLKLISKSLSAYGTTTLVVRGRSLASARTAFKHSRSVTVKVTVRMSIGGGASQTFTHTGRASIAH